MDDVNIGTFASAGQTPLVTISSADPLYVQFDMSESEYLSLTKNKSGTETLGDTLKLRLADGSIYQETGKIVQINPGLTGGQLTMKAAYANPDNLLVPGCMRRSFLMQKSPRAVSWYRPRHSYSS